MQNIIIDKSPAGVILFLEKRGVQCGLRGGRMPRPLIADPDNTGVVNILNPKCACLAGRPKYRRSRTKAFLF
jgi:hypothetical protein